ncbi:hypothetical protein R1flu_004768 [Riccia fluitans]|uniref:Uncharacterized protein n=1 Tax=Riccia fluitans TaxID=41844 RepID=A0ABD1YR79_9MARC
MIGDRPWEVGRFFFVCNLPLASISSSLAIRLPLLLRLLLGLLADAGHAFEVLGLMFSSVGWPIWFFHHLGFSWSTFLTGDFSGGVRAMVHTRSCGGWISFSQSPLGGFVEK